MTDPYLPPDDDARTIARSLLTSTRHAAMATLSHGAPLVTRTAIAYHAGALAIFVSRLSQHTTALLDDPRASLLLGDMPAKGDPLNAPRLTLQVVAAPVNAADPGLPGLREAWLAAHPKARLWLDFPDFLFFRLAPISGLLNGGFALAFKLGPDDLRP